MPLVSCPDCGADVSTEAPACPRCGWRMRRDDAPPSRDWVLPAVMGTLLLVGVLGMVWLSTRNTVEERDAAQAPADASRGRTFEEVMGDSVVLVTETETTVVATDDPLPAAYEISAVDVRPELINREEVGELLSDQYPPLLRDAGVGGEVMVKFRVNASGSVDAASPEVTRSTHDLFSEAAVRIVRQMRFRPAMLNGRAVNVWAEIPIQFQVAP